MSLIRQLYLKQWSKEQTLKIFNLIDWLLNLSAPLTLEFEAQLHALEEEFQMPYVNSIERLAIERLEQAQNEANNEREKALKASQRAEKAVEQAQNEREKAAEIAQRASEEIQKERARADAAEEESRRLRAELDRLRPSNGQVGPN